MDGSNTSPPGLIINNATGFSPSTMTVPDTTSPHEAFFAANAVVNTETGVAEEYPKLKLGLDSKLWIRGCAQEIGRLEQGTKEIPVGTNTMFFIPPQALPKGRKATYLWIIANLRPEKADPYRVRITVGGDRLLYNGPCSAPTAALTTSKVLFNSAISTPGARFCTLNIKNFYLGTPMTTYKYMWIPVKHIPNENIDQYQLAGLVSNGKVLV